MPLRLGHRGLAFLAHPPPQPALHLRRILDVLRSAPIVVLVDLDDVVVVGRRFHAEARMDEGRMGDVDAVLHHPRRFRAPMPFVGDPLPGRVVVFREVRQREALFLGRVAEEHPDHPEAFAGGIGVDARPTRRRVVLAFGRHVDHLPCAVVAPAVVRAGDAVALSPAAGERPATVQADVAQAMHVALRIAKQHEFLAQHPRANGLLIDGARPLGDVPQVDQHRTLLVLIDWPCRCLRAAAVGVAPAISKPLTEYTFCLGDAAKAASDPSAPSLPPEAASPARTAPSDSPRAQGRRPPCCPAAPAPRGPPRDWKGQRSRRGAKAERSRCQ